MKKFVIVGGLLLIVLVIAVPLIIYLFSRSESEKLSSGPNPTEEYQKFVSNTTITRIFRGNLPCKDCDGTETIISLSQKEGKGRSGDFSLAITYLGTDKDAQISSGNWIIKEEEETTKLLVLNFSDGSSQFYKWIDDDTLIKLKNDKSEFPNEDEYTLKLQ